MAERVRERRISGEEGAAVHTTSEEDDRGSWNSPVEFVLSCLGYAVGLGNIWRFPYLCYMNGGGAFLIPYTIMLALVGLPVFFIELAVGQYSGSGPMTLWSVSPIFQGVGAAMIVTCLIGRIYYTMIIGWAIYYTYASFQSPLPWSSCNNTYSTKYCYTKRDAIGCESVNGTFYINGKCYNETYLNSFDDTATVTRCNDYVPDFCWNHTYNPLRDIVANRTSPSEDYFQRAMLRQSDAIEDTGTMQWELCLVLFIAWVICFLCVVKGIKSSGKVVYFTATFPYLVLIILFFRGVTLPGALDGIKYFVIPEWSKLLTPKVWGDAAGQIFFSLSVGTGGLMTFSSYNKFHNNIYRDTMIVTIANCLTSVFAGFVIFSILGFMAHERGVDVPDVVKSGPGLAFIAYPEIVTHLPIPQLWSFLFFFMLITLGLDSQFAGIESIMTSILDTVPRLRRYKTLVSLALCIVLYILGLTMCTQAGIYWLEMMSYYAAGWSRVLTGLIEIVVFAWIYGADRLIENIKEMIGFRLRKHWWFCWKFITPLLLLGIFVVNVLEFTPLSVGDYVLPPWAQALGWLMSVVSVYTIVLFAVYHIWSSYKNPGYNGLTFWGRVVKLSQPTEEWDKRAVTLGVSNELHVMTEGAVQDRSPFS